MVCSIHICIHSRRQWGARVLLLVRICTSSCMMWDRRGDDKLQGLGLIHWCPAGTNFLIIQFLRTVYAWMWPIHMWPPIRGAGERLSLTTSFPLTLMGGCYSLPRPQHTRSGLPSSPKPSWKWCPSSKCVISSETNVHWKHMYTYIVGYVSATTHVVGHVYVDCRTCVSDYTCCRTCIRTL